MNFKMAKIYEAKFWSKNIKRSVRMNLGNSEKAGSQLLEKHNLLKRP